MLRVVASGRRASPGDGRLNNRRLGSPERRRSWRMIHSMLEKEFSRGIIVVRSHARERGGESEEERDRETKALGEVERDRERRGEKVPAGRSGEAKRRAGSRDAARPAVATWTSGRSPRARRLIDRIPTSFVAWSIE
jgi:hypothetical protein